MNAFPVYLCVLAVGGNDLTYKLPDGRRLLISRLLEALELHKKVLLIDLQRLSDVDLPVGCILHALFIHKHLFVQLLAGTQSCEDDLNVLAYLIAGKLDQVLGQVQNANRLSHIQNKDFSAPCVGAGLQHQGDSLRNSHKIPNDVRIRHRHRSAGRNLLFKQRDNASVGAKDIAEAHRHKIARIMAVEHLNDHLADALGGSHNVGGIDRLIRGDHDKALGAAGGCRHRRIEGAEDVVFDGLAGADLHERHMLVRSGMIDDIRTVLVENPVDALLIPDRCNQHHQIQIRIFAAQLLLHVIRAVLIDINQNQLPRMMSRNLPAKLRADGAAAAGDTDHLSLHIADDGIQIDLHRVPSQKVLHLNIVKLGDTDLAVYQLINAGKRAHLALGLLTDVQNPLHLGSGK